MLRQLRYDFFLLLKRTPFLIVCSVLIGYVFMLTFSSLSEYGTIRLENYGSAYMANLIMDQSSPFRFTSLLLVFPLIIAVPIGRMMIIERKCSINIFVRKSKRIYMISKHITSFVAGFLMMFMTLMFAIVFAYIIFGEEQNFYNQYMTVFYGYSVNNIKTLLRYYNLYFQNPLLYLVLYSLLVSLVMGIVSQLTMTIALFIHYKVIIYGGFFILSMFTVFIHPMIVPFYEILCPYTYVSSYLLNAQYFYPIFLFILSIILSMIYIRRDVIIK